MRILGPSVIDLTHLSFSQVYFARHNLEVLRRLLLISTFVSTKVTLLKFMEFTIVPGNKRILLKPGGIW